MALSLIRILQWVAFFLKTFFKVFWQKNIEAVDPDRNSSSFFSLFIYLHCQILK